MYLWIDTETTGLVPGKHAVIQIAAIITEEFFGEPIATFNETGGAKGFEVSAKALEVNRIEKGELKNRRKPKHLLDDFIKFLSEHVDRYDSKSKLTPVGYNVKFDTDMLFGFAKALKYPYLGAFLSGSSIDIMQTARWMDALGKLPKVKDHKLSTLLDAFDVDAGQSHDAFDDISVTMSLARRFDDLCNANPIAKRQLEDLIERLELYSAELTRKSERLVIKEVLKELKGLENEA